MKEFLLHYSPNFIVVALGALLVIISYMTINTKSSGVWLFGGFLIAVGFLTSPWKWLALLGLTDLGYWMIPYEYFEEWLINRKFKKEHKKYDITASSISEEKRIFVKVPETNEKLELRYVTNEIYRLNVPKFRFTVSIDKEGKQYVFADRCCKGGKIEVLPFDGSYIRFDGLRAADKDMTVEIEVKNISE